jgi:hypothetical protein
MEELQVIHSMGNTIIMVTHNPALTTYATRVINMLDGEIDTDIKTVSDADLPKSGGKNEKVSVKVLPSRDPIQMEIQSESNVVVSGDNVTTAEVEEPTIEEPIEEIAPVESPEDLPETTEATEELTEKIEEITETAEDDEKEEAILKRKSKKSKKTSKAKSVATRRKNQNTNKKERKK